MLSEKARRQQLSRPDAEKQLREEAEAEFNLMEKRTRDLLNARDNAVANMTPKARPGVAASVLTRKSVGPSPTTEVKQRDPQYMQRFLSGDTDDAVETALTKQNDMELHFLAPEIGGLGLSGDKLTEDGIAEQEIGMSGIDLHRAGLAGRGGAAKSGAYHNTSEMNPRLTALISSRKSRVITAVSEAASATLMAKQLRGASHASRKVKLSPEEVAALKKQLRGKGGPQALRDLIAHKEQAAGRVGFVDLYDLGFTITRVTMSSDLAHATIHWTAPCLMPLPEADLSKLSTPSGTLLEATVRGITSPAKYPTHPATSFLKPRMDPLRMTGEAVEPTPAVEAEAEADAEVEAETEASVDASEASVAAESAPEAASQAEAAEEAAEEAPEETPEEAEARAKAEADRIWDSVDWDGSEVVMVDPKSGVSYKRKPDGSMHITTVGDPKLWARRKAFQNNTYVGGMIDPLPTPMTPQLNVAGKAPQGSASLSTRSLIGNSRSTSHDRAVNVVVLMVSRYLDQFCPSIRWSLGDRLNLKYTPQVKFKFDDDYGRIKMRARSVASALQEMFRNADDTADGAEPTVNRSLMEHATKLRASVALIRGDTTDSAVVRSAVHVREDKRVTAAKLLRVDIAELRDLNEQDLDMLLESFRMMSRSRPVADEDVGKAMRGELGVEVPSGTAPAAAAAEDDEDRAAYRQALRERREGLGDVVEKEDVSDGEGEWDSDAESDWDSDGEAGSDTDGTVQRE
jgi:ribosome-binding factor A